MLGVSGSASLVFATLTAITVPAGSHAQQVDIAPSAADVKVAASKAVTLLQSTGANWSRKQFCTSCHHQILPVIALTYAQEHGVSIGQAAAVNQVRRSLALFHIDHAVQGWNPEMTVEQAYTLIAAASAGVRANPTAAAYVRLFARRQASDGRWLFADNRPPHAYSDITSTAIVLRALQLYKAPQMAAGIAERIKHARLWLEAQNPSTTEEYAFWLLGMHWAGATAGNLRTTVEKLRALQKVDGGWAQLARLPSDAYSTGQALVALREAGAVGVDGAAYKRGLSFLVNSQNSDGSWHVKSRIYHPIPVSPPYFETGFPHGHDQFISAAGTAWALMALTLSLPKVSSSRTDPYVAVMGDRLETWAETILHADPEKLRELLDHGFNPNKQTAGGTTALMMAAPDARKVRMLLDAGASVTAKAKSGFTALMVASAYKGSADSVRLLLEHGAEIEPADPQPTFDSSAAALAAGAGATDSLKLLLEKGASSRRRVVGFWLFENAFYLVPVIRGDVETVDYLARRMSATELGDALILSVLGNRTVQALRLIDAGADVNYANDLGMTPLMCAASIDYGDTQMIEILLRAKANVGIRTKDGFSAIDFARKYGHTDMALVLARALVPE